MKNLFTLLFTVLLVQAYSQQKHFSTSMAIRLESDSIFCDLIANDDYNLSGLSFGFHHNSDYVDFLDIRQVTLPGIDQLRYFENCPRYVRMIWTYPQTDGYQVKKGDVLLSLIYKELQPTDHFICMMPSQVSPNDKCLGFTREAYDALFNGYIVDDVCINYKIKDAVVIVSSKDEHADNINVCLNGQCNGLIIQNDEGFSDGNAKFQLININGTECMTQKLQTATNQIIDITRYPAGMYIYRIVTDNKSIKAGKVVLK